MRKAREARKDNMIVDETCYPWYAYTGLRFSPDQFEKVLTDLESDLLEALIGLERAGVLTEYLGDDIPEIKAKKKARLMIQEAEER